MTNNSRILYRLPKQGKISGVCAGLSEYFSFDVTIMRLIFVLLFFITDGTIILLYVIVAIILPTSDRIDSSDDKLNSNTVGKRIQRLGQDLKENGAITRARNYLGAFLLILGIWLLLGQFLPQLFSIHWNLIWPAFLIFAGLLIIIKKRN